MLSPKEQRQMWVYIILLTVIIGGLWFIFFKKQVSVVLNNSENKQEAKARPEPSLGEIFGQFRQSVSKGVQVISELKNQLPEAATTTPNLPIGGATTTDNLVK